MLDKSILKYFWEILNLIVWIILLIITRSLEILEGVSSYFLPVSLCILLIVRINSKRPKFDLSILFLLSSIFFFCIGLILSPFSTTSPKDFNSLVISKFTWAQLDSAAIWIGLSIGITIVTMKVFENILKNQYNIKQIEVDGYEFVQRKEIYKFGILFLLIALPAVMYSSYEQLVFIRNYGYLALYTEGVPVSNGVKLFFYIFDLGFGLTVAYAKTKKQYLLPAMLYIIIATIDSLKGARGALLVPLLYVGWFYINKFNIKVQFKSIMRSMILIICLFAILTFQRDPEMLGDGLVQFSLDALATQGRSLQMVAIYETIENQIKEFGNYTVLSFLVMPYTILIHPEIREAAQSMEHVLYSNNLKHIMTYILNKDYYFSGGGTGGVYTIELLEAGPIFYILLSILLGWFFAWFPTAMRKPWMRYLSVYFFTTIFYLPRGEFFFNSLVLGKAYLIYIIAICIYLLLFQKNRYR